MRAMGICALFLGLLGPPAAHAAAIPPAVVNYQGVLRDQNDNPLTGSYDVVLRFMDAATAGNEILIDQHTTATGNAVTVSGGLFNVAIGSGTVADGSGPGVYIYLDTVFRDYGAVWLEVKVGAETLSPRTPIQSAPYAINSMQLAGHYAGDYLTTTSQGQAKDGPLTILAGITGQCVGGGCTAVRGAAPDGANGGYFSAGSSINTFLAASGRGIITNGGSTGLWGSGTTTGVDMSGTVDGGLFHGGGVGYGVKGSGGVAGGYFTDPNGATATIAGGGYGVQGYGATAGGHFTGPTGFSATLAGGGAGISASGTDVGAYFSDGAPWFAYTQIPYHDLGIYAYGSTAGGQFNAFSTGNYALLAYSSYKILGTGAVSFVQNHPKDPSKVVVYVAPEGDEAAVYTRGSGRLVDGEARVRLGETFALVANPDIGLTATATPRGEPIPLAVSEVSPGELVVRGPAGSDAEFDFMVWGLRIGFEETSIVQPKRDESKIPSMHAHEQFFRDDPELRGYTALARYEKVEEQVRGRRHPSRARADSLRDAIGVSPWRDPAEGPPEGAPAPPPSHPVIRPEDAGSPAGITAPAPQAQAIAVPSSMGDRPARPVAAGGQETVVARAPADGLDFFDAADAVQAGDVVSLASASPGSVVRSSGSSDALVMGCAQRIETGTATAAKVAVATGRVALCRVDASYGAISVGDRLGLSPVPGMAIKADPDAVGPTILGRAIDPLESGSGLVRVLLGAR
ncbi:MAG TPA: hypothetical protein VFQ07_08305 [Candidatus Polarisedimenticolia bacterium]|nr:hypothetical protein [Candidatus Polarisedimenticolia bacterium]